MMYALINYGTGEVFTIIGENITAQYLYKRALSQRRKNVRYGYALDKMQLVKCSDRKHIMQGTIIQEWEGGANLCRIKNPSNEGQIPKKEIKK